MEPDDLQDSPAESPDEPVGDASEAQVQPEATEEFRPELEVSAEAEGPEEPAESQPSSSEPGTDEVADDEVPVVPVTREPASEEGEARPVRKTSLVDGVQNVMVEAGTIGARQRTAEIRRNRERQKAQQAARRKALGL